MRSRNVTGRRPWGKHKTVKRKGISRVIICNSIAIVIYERLLEDVSRTFDKYGHSIRGLNYRTRFQIDYEVDSDEEWEEEPEDADECLSDADDDDVCT